MTIQAKEKTSAFLTAVREAEASRPRGGPAWLDGLRTVARDRFETAGLPSAGEEAWRFTNPKPLARTAFVPAPAPEGAPRGGWDLAGAQRFLLVDGHAVPAAPAADGGAEVMSLTAAVTDDRWCERLGRLVDTDKHRFAALNTAFLGDGALVRVPATAGETLVHLVLLSTASDPPRLSHPRVLIELEEGARARVVEEYVSEAGAVHFTNAVTEAWVGVGASLEHYRVLRESDEAFHAGAVAARQDRDSRFTSASVVLGARWARVDVDVLLDGEGGECDLDGLYVTDGRRHVDHHTLVDHARPHTTSRQLYKGILDGRSSAVFNGRVLIREGAQQINAAQANNNLLLSSDALVNTNPELEIFADDVKARHGATVGQIDEEPLFYLRSRGIDLAAARRILIRGFMGDMIDRIGVAPLREELGASLGEKF